MFTHALHAFSFLDENRTEEGDSNEGDAENIELQYQTIGHQPVRSAIPLHETLPHSMPRKNASDLVRGVSHRHVFFSPCTMNMMTACQC